MYIVSRHLELIFCVCIKWYRCVSSSLNGEELVRDGGVLLLATLLSRCMYIVQRTTPGTDPAAKIVTNVMCTFAGLSKFRTAWKEMLQCPGFVEDVVHCSELEHAPVAVEAALQTMGNLAASDKLQDCMLKAGVLWYVSMLLSSPWCTILQTVSLSKACLTIEVFVGIYFHFFCSMIQQQKKMGQASLMV